jgi:hypothetical protein
LGIRIRIQEGKNDPHATILEKVKKYNVLSAGCSLLKAKGFSYSLSVLYGGLGINKIFTTVNFFNFWSSKPFIWIRVRLNNPDALLGQEQSSQDVWGIYLRQRRRDRNPPPFPFPYAR